MCRRPSATLLAVLLDARAQCRSSLTDEAQRALTPSMPLPEDACTQSTAVFPFGVCLFCVLLAFARALGLWVFCGGGKNQPLTQQQKTAAAERTDQTTQRNSTRNKQSTHTSELSHYQP
jgi:uncharacterized protein HemX